MRYFYYFSLPFILSGCLSLNIKSVLPNKTIYSLDTTQIKEVHCKAPKTIGFGNVTSKNYIDSKNVVNMKSNGEVSSSDTIYWADNPKYMLTSSLLKEAANNCINIDMTGANNEEVLFLNIFFVGFENNSPKIELGYKILDSSLKPLKIGVIKKQTRASNNANVQSQIANLQAITQRAIKDVLGNFKN